MSKARVPTVYPSPLNKPFVVKDDGRTNPADLQEFIRSTRRARLGQLWAVAGIDAGNWKALAIWLAVRHVPGLDYEVQSSGGRPGADSYERYELLQEIRGRLNKGQKLGLICEELSKEKGSPWNGVPPQTLRRRYSTSKKDFAWVFGEE